MEKVIIYTSPTCVYCKMTKDFFKENNIAYEEKDVSTDAAARDEMVAKSNQMGVPVIDIDGELIIGFNKKKISQLFNIKN